MSTPRVIDGEILYSERCICVSISCSGEFGEWESHCIHHGGPIELAVGTITGRAGLRQWVMDIISISNPSRPRMDRGRLCSNVEAPE